MASLGTGYGDHSCFFKFGEIYSEIIFVNSMIIPRELLQLVSSWPLRDETVVCKDLGK